MALEVCVAKPKEQAAAALISQEYPLAIYLHCASHCLNLAVVKSLDEIIRNMMGVIEKVWVFFSSHPKRQRKLEEAIQVTQLEATIQKLKHLIRTRWIQRIDALDLWSPESIADSKTLLLAITTTESISALVIVNACLHYLLSLTCSLQTEAKDIIEAIPDVNHVIAALKKVREHICSRHKEWLRQSRKYVKV